MTSLDYIILGIIGVSTLIGFLRGFTKECLSLLTWSGAAAITYLVFPAAKGLTVTYIRNPMIADGVTGFSVFVLTLIILSIITNGLANLARQSSLSGIDRGLGVGFGAARGTIIICVIEALFSMFTPRNKQSPMILNAKFIVPIRQASDELQMLLPLKWQKWQKNLSEQSQGLQKSVQNPSERAESGVSGAPFVGPAQVNEPKKVEGIGSAPAPTPPAPTPASSPSFAQIATSSAASLASAMGMGSANAQQNAQTTQAGQQTPHSQKNDTTWKDPKKMMESLSQLKIRPTDNMDAKSAADTQYNTHELDQLVTITRDEEKIKNMTENQSTHRSLGEPEHDIYEDDDNYYAPPPHSSMDHTE